ACETWRQGHRSGIVDRVGCLWCAAWGVLTWRVDSRRKRAWRYRRHGLRTGAESISVVVHECVVPMVCGPGKRSDVRRGLSRKLAERTDFGNYPAEEWKCKSGSW